MQTPKKTGQSGLLFGSLAANTMDRPTGETVDRLVNAGEGFLGKILRGPGPGKTFSWILLVPAIVAFGISCYLAYTTLTATDVAGCGGGTFDCSHVLNSKYSKWLGMPVSLLAAANYLAMLIALATLCLGTATNPWRRLCWAIVACCGLAAGMAAIWFISLQAFVIGHFCPWCLGAHACGLMIGAAILWQRPFGNSLAMGGSLLAGIGISGLILGQVLAEEPPTFKITEHGPAANQQSDDEPCSQDGASEEELFNPPLDEAGETFEAPVDDSTVSWKVPTSRIAASMAFLFSCSTSTVMLVASPMQEETQQEETQQETASGDAKQQETPAEEVRLVTIQGNRKLNPRQWPLLGSPDAEFIFVEMFDYACPHCRNTHKAIKGACETMGDNLAVIVLPVPLNTNCNNQITRTGANFMESCELARLAVACWRVDPEQFQIFHHWMFEAVACPSYSTAKAKVDELVSREKIDAELKKESANKYISKHVQLYQLVGKGVVPKLLFPTTTVEGEFTSANALVDLVRSRAK